VPENDHFIGDFLWKLMCYIDDVAQQPACIFISIAIFSIFFLIEAFEKLLKRFLVNDVSGVFAVGVVLLDLP